MTNADKAAMLRGLVAAAKGDNLERATAAFRGMTATEMAEQYGQSGMTRQRIMDLYVADRKRMDDAEAFLDELLQERGL